MLSGSDILAILQRVKELGYRRLRLEYAGLVLEVGTDSDSGHVERKSAASSSSSSVHTAQAAKAATAAEAASHPEASLIAVKSPMSGIFFRAPAPNAPPFVDVGSHVSANDAVCIIEVMKLFNTIVAGVDGTVVEIAVENEKAVVTGQAVIWIRPD